MSTGINAQLFQVFRGEQLVLELRAIPGQLVSTASLPRGSKAKTHPFIDAQAFVASEEGRLGHLLSRATSADEFLSLLTDAGYRVERKS